MKPHFYLFIILINIFIAKANAQSITPTPAFSCVESMQFEDTAMAFPSTLIITNETDSTIAFLLHFKDNGFYDEASLIHYIMRGVDTLTHKTEKQLRVLDNIAAIIKSPMFRNYHLLFTSQVQGIVRKMYSPMLMLTSFYDMQCHHFQRLAAQIAFLTSYFNATDFETYYVLRHNVLGVRIGNRFVFHDFDPGQPGFRFSLNDSIYAGIDDILDSTEIITAPQFYANNALCPWISTSYYRSSFTQIHGRSLYAEMASVYGFVPQWIIPPGAKIEIAHQQLYPFSQFGTKIFLDSNIAIVKEIFNHHRFYGHTKSERDSLLLTSLFNEFMIAEFGFDYDINYVYLLNKGLVVPSDTSYALNISDEYLLSVHVEALSDTLYFLNDLFIPLPLRRIIVETGSINIKASENGLQGTTTYQYNITDSLSFDYYNTLPPVFTPDSMRRPLIYDDKPFVVGPTEGFLLPGTKATLYYPYNPNYYKFTRDSIDVNYITPCERKISFIIR